MRFVPLLSSRIDPASWRGFPAVELAWEGELHPAWGSEGPEVHALHAPSLAPDAAVLQALFRLGADFLVLPVAVPEGRQASAALLGHLEVLLEATSGRGPKLALRTQGDAVALVRLLREVRGEAVGFCWDGQAGHALDAISDRLFCARAEAESDLSDLARHGYRWNVAIPVAESTGARELLADLSQANPEPLFPKVLPDLGARGEA